MRCRLKPLPLRKENETEVHIPAAPFIVKQSGSNALAVCALVLAALGLGTSGFCLSRDRMSEKPRAGIQPKNRQSRLGRVGKRRPVERQPQ